VNHRRDALVILVILSQTSVAVIMSHIIRASDNINLIKTWLPFWEVLILVLALFSIASIKNIYSNARESIKTSLIKEHLQQVETLLTVLQSEKHEFSRHLQALQSFIYLNRSEEAKRYIDGIADRYWNTNDGVLINHPALSSLVNSKLNLTKSQGIDFKIVSTCDFSQLKIEPWDLCSIVGNLVDNAIESALQDKVHPWVEAEFEHQNGDFIFCVRNNGVTINKDDIERIFEAGFTSRDSIGRGYGLYIVKNLVNLYGGSIEVFSEKQTTILVKLPGGN